MRYTNKYVPLGIRQKMIMHLLWDSEEKLTTTEIAEGLKKRYDVPLTPNATATMLKTLITRGYVEKGPKKYGNFLYGPTVTKHDFLVEEMKWMNEIDFGSSAVALWKVVLDATKENDDFEKALASFES